MEKEYLTIKEVAEWIGFDHQTVRRYMKLGKLKYSKIGDGKIPRYRIAISDVLEWIRKKD
jgi:excisionase family DNA binding protein